MTVFFISDLHLTPKRPKTNELFFEFISTIRPTAKALYILGDLFEFWVGDDAVQAVGQTEVFSALRHLTEGGVPVFFMHGNRDFLVGDEFAAKTGCRILPDPSQIRLDGLKVLLTHGDSMCTDDTAHQQFRDLVNDPNWKREFLSYPINERMELALTARSQSAIHKSMTSMEVMDVNPAAVEREIGRWNVDYLIHGHTHRPGIHTLHINGKHVKRIVLGDWYEQSSVLRYERGKLWLSAKEIEFPPV